MFSTRSFRSFLPSAIRMLIHDGKRARGTSGMVGGEVLFKDEVPFKFLISIEFLLVNIFLWDLHFSQVTNSDH